MNNNQGEAWVGCFCCNFFYRQNALKIYLECQWNCFDHNILKWLKLC